MDRRQKKTREAIFAAFSSLLEIKSYSKVTIQEIIDKANIGRSTFYSHFETKDDLLKELCTDLFDHVFSECNSIETTHDFSHNKGSYHAIIMHILYHLLDNRKYIVGIFGGESSDYFYVSLKNIWTSWLYSIS